MSAALATAAIFGCAGLAVDYSRIQHCRVVMAAALDSAIIATAAELNVSALTRDGAEAYLQDFLRANMGEDAAKYDVRVDSVTIDWNTEQVSAAISTDLPMTLMKVAGWDVMPVSVEASSMFGVYPTEVAMTFDITGSMEGSKLADLKNAAKKGIDELLALNVHKAKLRVSVIPYAEAVNGGTASKWAYASAHQYKYRPDDCLTERPGKWAYSDAGPEKGPPFRDSRLERCPTSAIQPLTSDEALLDTAIEAMTADGFTAGHIGIQWAWFTISPNWANIFSGDSAPASYGSKVNKFAVIMTDGEFNTAYQGVPQSSNIHSQALKSQAAALELCTNMKAKGIRIFTIGFALKDKDALDTMEACASPEEGGIRYFYQAASGTDLADVYERIAALIRVVRLVR